MNKLSAKRKPRIREAHFKDQIVIDEPKGLVFSTEDDLYKHFLPQIQALEKEYFENRGQEDVHDKEFHRYEGLLSHVLDDPDEVWEDTETFKGMKVYSFVGHFTSGEDSVYYVALTYMTAETPSFVFLHFQSRQIEAVDRFRRGNLVYDRVMKEVEKGAVEGDALTEGDDLAVGLYRAMLKLRSEKDINEEKFKEYEELREKTIEEADEIWRTNDLAGNILVSFIKEFPDEAQRDLTYVVVTIEDTPSSSHALLFSFPTRDKNLVDRYRHGENLQAEEVVQEASH